MNSTKTQQMKQEIQIILLTFIPSFIHSISKYLLSAKYVPGIIQNTRYIWGGAENSPALKELLV